MKNLFAILFFFFHIIIFSCPALSQSGLSGISKIDSIKRVLLTENENTNTVAALNELASQLETSNSDSALSVYKTALALATKLKYKTGIADSKTGISRLYFNKGQYTEGGQLANEAIIIYSDLVTVAEGLNRKQALTKLADGYNALEINTFPLGNYPAALQIAIQELTLREELGDKKGISYCEFNMGNIYYCQHNYSESLRHYFNCLKVSEQRRDTSVIGSVYSAIGLVYFDQLNYEEASRNYSKSLMFALASRDSSALAEVYANIGVLKEKQESYDEALKYDFAALKMMEEIGNSFNVPFVLNNMAMVYLKQKKYSMAAEYLAKALLIAKKTKHPEYIKLTYENLTQFDSLQGNYKKAWEDYKLSILYRDSLLNKENTEKITQQQMQYDFDKKQALFKADQDKKDAEAKRIKNQQYFIIVVLGIVVLAIFIISLIQYRSNKHKQKANTLLHQQKEKVESTLAELKTTQVQLIQSEKMASLGELTAGIAHEIQNPLNFVNNFSEVSTELVGEMNTEMDQGNYADARLIAGDLKLNLEKINLHGKRAGDIVKGMLQHSRSSSGQKELTDINALCDEYLRLAYHGLRAKDKNFNPTLIPIAIGTDFDETIAKINVIPQDIGRVILNLINNAFYAVHEREKLSANGQQLTASSYEPTVTIATKRMFLPAGGPQGGRPGYVEIRVTDNGNGIPQKILDKIFQPFFTTKPTGQGTGLGLSLSYDIVKAHGGELKVKTKEARPDDPVGRGEGSEFVIVLPIN